MVLASKSANLWLFITLVALGLVADPVIKAIARLELEDGMRTMRTGVLPGGCWGP